jgi:hypothetical protein
VAWVSDGTAVPCEAAGACTYTPASEDTEETCAATDLAQCADWTSDGTADACLAVGACAYTAAVTEADFNCVQCPAGTQHYKQTYEYLGCFTSDSIGVDNASITMEIPSQMYRKTDMAFFGTRLCAEHCRREGYQYLGLHWTDSCSCGMP